MNILFKQLIRILLLVISITLLVACGGEETTEDTTSTGGGDEGGIIGTAKVIVVSSDSKVEAKSKSGQVLSATINAQGKYKLASVQSETYLLRAKKTASSQAGYFYSIAHSNGTKTVTSNLHSFSDLILRNWFAVNQLDINAEFISKQAIQKIPSLTEINAIEGEVKGIILKALQDYKIDQGIDLISTQFDINGEGFDNFLDKNIVIINSNNQITLIIKQASGNAISISIDNLDLAKNFTDKNDTPPTTPSNLRAYPQDAQSIILRWESSNDDKGVSGYDIYRDGNKVGSSPYPLFTDKNLNSAKSYRYQVQAVDGRNQTSALTSQTNLIQPSDNVSIELDGSYTVVVTSTSAESVCSGATGNFSLSNETDITGSISSTVNNNYVFQLTGKRDKNTGAITGGFAVTSGQNSGITYASISGVIDALYANGNYEDIRGCKGVWVANKQ